MFNAWAEMDRARAQRAAVAENSGRLAFAYGQCETTGWGEMAIDACINFELTFIEMPYVSYGFALDGDELIDTRFPRCSGGVMRWRLDRRGFYTGAWVCVSVDTLSAALGSAVEDPNYTIDHFFTFSGIALKDVNAHLLTDF